VAGRATKISCRRQRPSRAMRPESRRQGYGQFSWVKYPRPRLPGQSHFPPSPTKENIFDRGETFFRLEFNSSNQSFAFYERLKFHYRSTLLVLSLLTFSAIPRLRGNNCFVFILFLVFGTTTAHRPALGLGLPATRLFPTY